LKAPLADLILHHYPTSPFAEKVRLVLGSKGISWKSVLIPTVMPKPDLTALTGGYRKTPVLQIGGDIYCDTALICRVIDQRFPAQPLWPAGSEGTTDMLAMWADETLFWTAVGYAMQPAGLPHIMGNATPEQMKAFAADRAGYAPNNKRLAPHDSTAALRTELGWLEAQLMQQSQRLATDHGPWLAGPARSLADFSAAHSLWFVRLAPPVATIFNDYPRVSEWLDRMLSIGHGHSTRMKSGEAVGVAATGAALGLEPVAVEPDLGLDAGADITVAATDTGMDPVAGRLVGLTLNRVTLERRDERAGLVHVHFPRIRYQILKAKT
jgi:glutathione S-transferase